MRALRFWTDIANWRWAPALGLAFGAVLFVAFAVLAIPDRIGNGAPSPTGASGRRTFAQQRTSINTSISPNVGADGEVEPAGVAQASQPSRSPAVDLARFPRRGFSPPLDRPEPPPPAPPPAPAIAVTVPPAAPVAPPTGVAAAAPPPSAPPPAPSIMVSGTPPSPARPYAALLGLAPLSAFAPGGVAMPGAKPPSAQAPQAPPTAQAPAAPPNAPAPQAPAAPPNAPAPQAPTAPPNAQAPTAPPNAQAPAAPSAR